MLQDTDMDTLFGVLVVSLSILQRADASSWGYYQGGTHPSSWHTLTGYSTCSGTEQSPIDVTTSIADDDTSIPLFDFSDLADTTNVQLKMINDGHRVMVELEDRKPELIGGGISGTFELKEFHFHWGNASARGSEHTIDGHQYPLELHMVFTKTGSSDIFVVGTLIDVDSSNNTKYAPIISNLNSVTSYGSHISVTAFDLTDLLPSDRCFFRYAGSLTTPPCSQVVTWSVFEDIVEISEYQLSRFRQLVGDSIIFPGGYITNNYRPIQSLNNRPVYHVCE